MLKVVRCAREVALVKTPYHSRQAGGDDYRGDLHVRCCNPYLLQCKGGLHLLTTLSHWLLFSADFVHRVVQTFSSHRWGSEKPGLRRENLCMRVRCTLRLMQASSTMYLLLTTAGPPRRSFRLHRTIRSQQRLGTEVIGRSMYLR